MSDGWKILFQHRSADIKDSMQLNQVREKNGKNHGLGFSKTVYFALHDRDFSCTPLSLSALLPAIYSPR